MFRDLLKITFKNVIKLVFLKTLQHLMTKKKRVNGHNMHKYIYIYKQTIILTNNKYFVHPKIKRCIYAQNQIQKYC